LIIELDGEIHDDIEQMNYDVERDKYLNNMGYTLLRFKNELVLEELDKV